jgi:predicted MPP superfamily phosphohydrolase
MRRLLNLLRRLIIPDTALKAMKSENPPTRLAAKIYLVTQVVTVALALWAFWWEPNSLTLNTYDFVTPPELAAWRGKRIAIITDLHAGSPWINEAKIDKVVNLTLSAHPDLILMPGDFLINGVTGGTYMPPQVIAGHLKTLHAPLGVYAVLGNHDNWTDAPGMRKALESNGIPVLDDEARQIPGTKLWLAGLSDFDTGKLEYKKALAAIPPGQFAICTTHEPDSFPLLPKTCPLTVAGHTHGGQVNLPLLGRMVVPSKYGSKYAQGFITENDRTVFVSTGIGTSIIPVRFRVPPEVSVLRLR